MGAMDAAQSALNSLRTVEFRETLKGYHRDDVDEYLEKAAIEAEGLQEQFRLSGERLRQAGERIAQLEAELENREPVATGGNMDQVIGDDTLQRTLLLAQKFVDQTKADSEARAAQILTEAEEHARNLTSEAETKATRVAADSERRLRDEIARLEGIRGQLSGDVETMARHLEGERNRLRSALTEVLKWVEDNVQPAATLAGQRPSTGNGQEPDPGPRSGQGSAGSPSSPAPAQFPGTQPSGSGSANATDTGRIRSAGGPTSSENAAGSFPFQG